MFQRLWREVTNPHRCDRRAANERVWRSLDETLRRPDQALGRQLPGCAATHSVHERCDFACTACYLANTANRTPPLPFSEVRTQLDSIREHLGEQGNVQITAGEVTLLPVEYMCRVVRYATSIDLSPMVMTHGERFRTEPDYLERLVDEGGLRKVAIHVDTTQNGRRGLRAGDRERDIDWLRDELADVIRGVRRRTGLPLAAAQTITVTEDNLRDVADIVRWSHRNADAFRMISFQPAAATGRTREGALSGSDVRRRQLWEQICAGAGQSLNQQSMLFGHPRCNQVNLHFVVRFDDELQVVEVVRAGVPSDIAFWRYLMERSFAGFSPDGISLPESVANLAGRICEDPRLLFEAIRYCGHRVITERHWLSRLVSHALCGGTWSVHPFVIVVHHFMSSTELDTPEGAERLAACTFRVPVGAQMVSMCQLNGTELRRQLNIDTRRRLPVVA